MTPVSVKDWKTEQLEGALGFLKSSTDPHAEEARRIISAELQLRFGKFANSRRVTW